MYLRVQRVVRLLDLMKTSLHPHLFSCQDLNKESHSQTGLPLWLKGGT